MIIFGTCQIMPEAFLQMGSLGIPLTKRDQINLTSDTNSVIICQSVAFPALVSACLPIARYISSSEKNRVVAPTSDTVECLPMSAGGTRRTIDFERSDNW